MSGSDLKKTKAQLIAELERLRTELEFRDRIISTLTSPAGETMPDPGWPECGRDVVARLDPEGRFLYISPSVKRYFSLHPKDFIGTTISELDLPEGLVHLWRTGFQEVRESGEAQQIELSFDGVAGPVEWDLHLIPEAGEDGEFNSVICLGRDLTEQREARRRHVALLEQMTEGFSLQEIIRDESGQVVDYRFLSVNPAFERMTGLRASQILGRRVREVLPGTERHWIEAIGRVDSTGEPLVLEDHHHDTDGFYRVRHFRVRPGRVASLVENVTEARRAQRSREQAALELRERMKELNCLYQLSQTIQIPGITLDEIMDRTVRILPSGHLDPDQTGARITLRDEVFLSQDFQETSRGQSVDLQFSGETQGRIEVFYPDSVAASFEDHLQQDKQNLLAAMAEGLGRAVERMESRWEGELALLRTETLLQLNQLRDSSPREIADFALEGMVRDTQSAYGFIGFLSEDEQTLTGISWSKAGMADCAGKDQPVHFSLAGSGLWAETVRKRSPLIIDDYSRDHPAKKGTPEGHVPLHNFAGIPVFDGDRIVAVGGLANKRGGFAESDLKHVEVLLGEMWRLLRKKEADEALRASEEKFRTIYEYSPLLIDAFDREGRCIMWNRAMVETYGWTMADLQAADDPLALLYPDPETREALRRAVTRQPDNRFREYHPTTKDGRKLTCMWANFHLPDGTIMNVGYDLTERIRADQALQESEEKYRAMVMDSPVGVGVAKGNEIVFLNPTYVSLFGYDTLDELLEVPLLDLVAPESRPLIKEKLAQIAAGDGGPFEYEYQILRKDGQVRSLYAKSSPIIIGGEQHRQIVAYDVTELRRAEQELHQFKQFARALIDAVGDALFLLAPDGTFVLANQEIARRLGKRVEELVGESPFNLMPAEASERRRSYLNQVLETGKKLVIEDERGGRIFENRVYPIRSETGSITHVAVYGRDVTERRQWEESLQREQFETARLNTLLENIMVQMMTGLIVTDLEGRVLLANRTAQEALGVSHREITGGPIEEISPDLAVLRKWVGPANREAETMITLDDGREVPIGFNSSHLHNRSGERVGVITVFKDLTEVKEIRATLQFKEKMATIGEIAKTIAHEIKNPLFAISATLQNLEQNLLGLIEMNLVEESEPTLRMISLMYQETQRINGLINAMTLYGREPDLKLKKANLRSFLNTSVETHAGLFAEKGLIVKKRLHDRLPPVLMDPDKVSQVLSNIIMNGVAFSPTGGELLIAADLVKGEKLEVSVGDRGSGISAEALDRVFEPFFSTRRGGSGLGLAICHKIVKAHGWSISARNRRRGGAMITITIPLP